MKLLIELAIGVLIIGLILFIMCACKLASECNKWEEKHDEEI